MKHSLSVLLARMAILPVFGWNILCAAVFILQPELYAGNYELAGIPGAAAVRGVGILFLMWNVPYAVALWHPVRQRVALYEATAMQAIGLAGETFIWLSLPAAHNVLRDSILRFIVFDGAGLVLLITAVVLARRTLAKT